MFPVVMMDDYPVVVFGVELMLQPWSDQFRVLAPTTTATDMATVVLYDPMGRPAHDIQRASEQIAGLCQPRVLVYTWHFTLDHARQMIEAGASGMVSKRLPAARLADAIIRTHQGTEVVEGASTPDPILDSPDPRSDQRPRLSPRERAILQAIGQHRPNVDIAADMGLSLNTVKSYIRNAYRKIGARTRTDAVVWIYTHLDDETGTTQQ